MEENKNEVIYGAPKKSNGGLVVVIVLLLLIVLGLGGFIFVNKDKLFNSNKTNDSGNDKEEPEVVEKVELDANDSTVTKLFNIFRIDGDSGACWKKTDIEVINNENYAKLRVAYDQLGSAKFDISCSKVGGILGGIGAYCGNAFGTNDSEINEAYAAQDTERFKELVESRISTKAIYQKDLKAKVLELFGKDYNYKDEDFGIGVNVKPSCGVMHYVESEGVYASYSGQCGGTCAMGEQKITKAYKEGDKLFIESAYSDQNPTNYNVNYEFKREKSTGNYIFVKVVKE